MRRATSLLAALTLTERIIVSLLVVIILVSGVQIVGAFFDANSEPVPGTGGVHIEGVTGQFQFLNPVLAQTDLDRDVTALTSCSLMRFDPVANTVAGDAATHTLSPDQRTYTFTLKDDLIWHDGEPVTADDVIFTFREVIQHEAFPNPALAADFADVSISKIDDRTITMTLKKKYAFFVFNTTVGLLPKHLLEDVPVADFLSAPFNLRPVGCGPYAVESVTGNNIRLRAFAQYFKGRPYLDAVVFRIFPSQENLFRNIDGVTGTKNLTSSQAAALRSDARLDVHEFTLPQYVGLFFNLDRDILKDRTLRLGLQLATNKEAVADAAGGDVQILDTPLLEIATSDWQYEYDGTRADGALFDAGWRYPGSVGSGQFTVDSEPTSTVADAQWISAPSSEEYYATDSSDFFIRGTAPTGTSAVVVNGYQLRSYVPGQTWSYRASTAIGTLPTSGTQEYVIQAVVGGETQEIDRVTIFRASEESTRTAWLAEQQPVGAPTAETKETATAEIELDTSIRYSDTGEPLALSLLVLADMPELVDVAEEIQTLWARRGVQLTVDAVDRPVYATRLSSRDYDIVIAGQNMGYNLDTYPFWHSSQAGVGGSNLSNLKSSGVNAWLTQIRGSFDSSERRKRLSNLSDTFAEEVPAVILYTPIYHYAVDESMHNMNIGRIALVRDRLAGLHEWYLHQGRQVTGDIGVFAFLSWFIADGL